MELHHSKSTILCHTILLYTILGLPKRGPPSYRTSHIDCSFCSRCAEATATSRSRKPCGSQLCRSSWLASAGFMLYKYIHVYAISYSYMYICICMYVYICCIYIYIYIYKYIMHVCTMFPVRIYGKQFSAWAGLVNCFHSRTAGMCYIRCRLPSRATDPNRRVQVPIFQGSGPKSHTLNGFWDQSS